MGPTETSGTRAAPDAASPAANPNAAVPITARAKFAHASLQVIADGVGVDLLHIKGAALDPRLGAHRLGGTDADVLVRPRQLQTFLAAIAPHGWAKYADFATGSAFEHAATFWHDYWGYADVHRHFPGVGVSPDEAFDLLWRDRQVYDIAGFECTVPNFAGQALVLILHAGRSVAGSESGDVRVAWQDLAPAEAERVLALREELSAYVAFAAGTGDLDAYADHPEHDLWAHFISGDTSRTAEWRARIKAAPTRTAALRLAVKSLAVNRDHLAQTLGHEPTRLDVARAFVGRGRTFARERARRGSE